MKLTKEQAQIEYDKIIEFRKENILEKSEQTYTEVHHIKPRSFFPKDTLDEIINDDNNLVRLTAKEHFLAHYYLYHTFNTKSKEYKKSLMGFNVMPMQPTTYDNRYINANLYQKGKEDYNILLKTEGICRLKEICDFVENNGLPNSGSNCSRYELSISSKLSSFKISKHHNVGRWFDDYQKYVDDRGFSNLFDIYDNKKENIKKLVTLCQYISEYGKPTPSNNTLYNSLRSFRKMRLNEKWEDSYESIISKYNLSDMFKTKNIEEDGLKRIKKICNFIDKHNRTPSTKGKNTDEIKLAEQLTALKLSNKYKYTNDKSFGLWFDSYDKYLEKHNKSFNFEFYDHEKNLLKNLEDINNFICVNNRIMNVKNNSEAKLYHLYVKLRHMKHINDSKWLKSFDNYILDNNLVKFFKKDLKKEKTLILLEELCNNLYSKGINCIKDNKTLKSRLSNYKNRKNNNDRWYKDFDDIIEKYNVIEYFKSCKKVVCKFTTEDIFIEEYKSISEASDKNNINGSTISGCCRGRYSTAGGFKWKYKN